MRPFSMRGEFVFAEIGSELRGQVGLDATRALVDCLLPHLRLIGIAEAVAIGYLPSGLGAAAPLLFILLVLVRGKATIGHAGGRA